VRHVAAAEFSDPSTDCIKKALTYLLRFEHIIVFVHNVGAQ